MKEVERIKKRKLRRRKRVRAKIMRVSKIGNRSRLSIVRSNKYLYAQIIDDKRGVTLLGVHEKEVKGEKLTKSQRARELGRLLAGMVKKKKIKEVVFDRGVYKYHGRIKAFAEGAREGGLEF